VREGPTLAHAARGIVGPPQRSGRRLI